MPPDSRIRCRQIGAADLAAIADLFARGFPRRPRAYWMRGLDRLAARKVPEGLPRFGFMLESNGAAVGAILLIAQTITHAGAPFVRCNLASWYVDPLFRTHAALLSMVPLRYKNATFLNVSPAPNTWATVEAQGFCRYTFGQRLTLPSLRRSASGLTLAPFSPDRDRDLAESTLLADHAATGCIALVGRSPDGPAPFVLLPFRGKQGRLWLPGVQLVFCRRLADVERFAAPLGRLLLRRGTPFLVHDAAEGATGLPGIPLKGRARKYVRGTHTPDLGDLAYTEFTIFGP